MPLKNLLFIPVVITTLACFLVSCEGNNVSQIPHLLRPGKYLISFQVDSISIPAELRITDDSNWVIHNWTEHIHLDSITWKDSLFRVKMPLFNTTLEGTVTNDNTFEGIWTDLSRTPLYQIPFTAKLSDIPAFPENKTPEKLIYSVLFSPESPADNDRAIGMFYKYDSLLYGTFLTGSGDHRFLQGKHLGDSITLSCFDGSHLFYYHASVSGDTLQGKFYSGKHHSENWTGILNPEVKLSHPDSLTGLKNPQDEFRFKVRGDNGDSVLFDKAKFTSKVSIVQIFGSWCPNCTDESLFFKKLYEKYHKAGLEIIPVAFERSEDFAVAQSNVHKQFREMGLAYPPYYGPKIGRGAASKVFTGLTDITAYPTSIFIDKQGNVRKIHTGFYGPGTGDYYRIHTAELESFLQQLLNE